jgi:hypothetical protein
MTCQSGFHDQDIPYKLHSQIVHFGEDVMNTTLCDVCFGIIAEANENNVDLTMSTIYRWGKELGSPQLLEPLTFRNCAEIAYSVNSQIDNIKRRTVNCNIHFPVILRSLKEKFDFIKLITTNQIIMKNLQDIDNENDKGSIALCIYAGCIDAAKCTRDSHNSATGFYEYTPQKRLEESKIVKLNSDRDSIYAMGARAALPFEFIFNGHTTRYLENIPINSKIRDSLRKVSRNKTVVTPEDIMTVI